MLPGVSEVEEAGLRFQVQKAGLLNKPTMVYGGVASSKLLDQLNNGAKNLPDGGLVVFSGLSSWSLDPDVALAPGVTSLIRARAITGLEVPGDELEVIQCDTQYRVTGYQKSPTNEMGEYLEIFDLEEQLRV